MSWGWSFVETLKRLNYPNAQELQHEGFDWMFENDAVTPFLDWFVDNVGPANVLSSQELEEFHTLEISDDGILDGEQLEEALKISAAEEEEDLSEDKLKDDIAALEEEMQRAQRSRKRLLQLRDKLSLHHTALTHKLTKLTPVESQTSGLYKADLENGQVDNTQVNASLDELNSTIGQLVALYGGTGDSADAPFLSQQPLQTVHQAEENFTQALKQFTKRQFFEGIAELAGHNEESRYQLLEVSDPRSLLIRGEKSQVTEADCQELARLKALYPASQQSYMKAVLEESRITAAHRLAERRLHSLQTYSTDVQNLSERLEQCERDKNSAMNSALNIWDQEIPQLLEVNAALQTTHILSGDYNLKIARQDYFTSKQDKLIEWLTVQRTRKEFLDMSYEVEGHHHRNTHRLMTAAEKLLGQSLTSHHTNMAFLSDPDLTSTKNARTTVDSRDTMVNRLHSILSNSGASNEKQLFLTYSRLLDDSRQFMERLVSLRESLGCMSDDQEGKLAAMEQNLRKCENLVYAGSTTKDGQPVLTPPTILSGITQLDKTLEDLTQRMLDLMGDYNNKLKVLKSDSLLSRQRQLYVQFLTEPSQLRRELQALTQQLQALSIA